MFCMIKVARYPYIPDLSLSRRGITQLIEGRNQTLRRDAGNTSKGDRLQGLPPLEDVTKQTKQQNMQYSFYFFSFPFTSHYHHPSKAEEDQRPSWSVQVITHTHL